MHLYRKALRTILGLTLVVSAACATTANRTGPEHLSAEKLRMLGEKFLGAGNAQHALKYLTMAEQKSPEDLYIQYDLALAYSALHQTDKAVYYLQQVVAQKPDYSEAHNALGALYTELGSFNEAQNAFQRALSNPFYKTPHYVHFNLGQLYEKRGQTEAALAEYAEAVRSSPQYAAAHYRMGVLLETTSRLEEARYAYGKTIMFSPDNAGAHYSFARLSYEAGDIQSAITSFNRVVRLDPHSSMGDSARKYLEQLQAPSDAVRSGSSSRIKRGAPQSLSVKQITELQSEIEQQLRGTERNRSSENQEADVNTRLPQAKSRPAVAFEQTAVSEPLPKQLNASSGKEAQPEQNKTAPIGNGEEKVDTGNDGQETGSSAAQAQPETPKPQPVELPPTETAKVATADEAHLKVPNEAPAAEAPQEQPEVVFPDHAQNEALKKSLPEQNIQPQSPEEVHPVLTEQARSEETKEPSSDSAPAESQEIKSAESQEAVSADQGESQAKSEELPKISLSAPVQPEAENAPPVEQAPKDPVTLPIEQPRPESVPAPPSERKTEDMSQGPQNDADNPERWRYLIQVSTFRSQGKAEMIRERLQAKGYSANLKTVTNSAYGQLFMVHLDPVYDQEEAKGLMTKLKAERDLSPLLVKSPVQE
jgi:tetratricopeptide (TPR) repeat protein/cell division septation protein DedD